MPFEAKILADSVSPAGFRLTTFQITLPRIVLAELNTHRMLSRNSASSRAIPVEKMMARVGEDPFYPVHWGANQKGMQAEKELTAEQQDVVKAHWRAGLGSAIHWAGRLLHAGVHKQITNRLLEPWMFHTVIITATELENYFNLRRDKHAQPEIRKSAEMMWGAYDSSTPKALTPHQWHLPLVPDWDDLAGQFSELDIAKISCGRCARVSYLTHDGERDPNADLALVDERLIPAGHMSPLEHAARPMFGSELDLFSAPTLCAVDGALDGDWSKPTYFCGNFQGWVQMRKLIPGEAVFRGMEP